MRVSLRALPRLGGIAAFLLAATAALGGSVQTNALLSGTRFATEVYLHDSGKPGPTVMIVGGVHGNEPAGAVAAENVRHWPLRQGRLVVLPRANVPALNAGKRLTPNLGTNLSNLNRNYPRAGTNSPPRGELATAIWQLALMHHPDWVLDLHEGYDFHQLNEKSVGSSIIAFPVGDSRRLADLMLAAVNAGIDKPELKFVRRDMPVDGSLARAAGEHLRVPGLTLETTSKQPLARRVAQHETMVHRLLAELDMIGRELPLATRAKASTPESEPPGKLPPAGLRIALYKGPGTGGAGPTNLLRRFRAEATTRIEQVSPEDIRAGALTNFQAVIFAGGSGSKQAAALEDSGREAVRRFVADGGGYIGICAGAYLATSGYSWSLGLINARTVSPKWQRGKGNVQLELTAAGKEILGARQSPFDCRYVNGPIVQPDAQPDLPPYEVLARFRTELAENNTPAGIMLDSPAIFAAPYFKGRVVCVSPHPEQTTGLGDFIPRALQWTLDRQPPSGASAPVTSE